MDQHYEFTEEMFRQLYRRMGYQVYRLCCHAEDDPQKAMDLTFRVFSDAYRKLRASAHPLTEELQDAALLECARAILLKDAPAAPAVEPLPQPGFAPAEVPNDPPAAQPSAREPAPPSVESVLSAAGLNPVAPIEATQEELIAPPQEAVLEPADSIRQNFGDAPAAPPAAPSSGGRFGWFLLIVILILFIFVLLWAIWGIAQTIFPLPRLDLGYEWFNATVYPLF